MERVCFSFDIFEGTEEEYDRRHAEIWPELVKDIRAAGFRDYNLYRRGTTVIAHVLCEPDADTAFARLSESQVDKNWAEFMREVIVNLTDNRGDLLRFRQVWHLD